MKRLNSKDKEYIERIFRSFAYWYDENNERREGLAFFDYRPWLETEPEAVLRAAQAAEQIHWMQYGLKELHRRKPKVMLEMEIDLDKLDNMSLQEAIEEACSAESIKKNSSGP